MFRKLKWQIPGEPLAARYNWCQGPVPGRGQAVEKHCCRDSEHTQRRSKNAPTNLHRIQFQSSFIFVLLYPRIWNLTPCSLWKRERNCPVRKTNPDSSAMHYSECPLQISAVTYPHARCPHTLQAAAHKRFAYGVHNEQHPHCGSLEPTNFTTILWRR